MFVHCEAVRDQQLYGNVHKIIQIHKNIQIQPLKLLNSNTRFKLSCFVQGQKHFH